MKNRPTVYLDSLNAQKQLAVEFFTDEFPKAFVRFGSSAVDSCVELNANVISLGPYEAEDIIVGLNLVGINNFTLPDSLSVEQQAV